MNQRKRYQIFVSSTFDDLKEERSKVLEAILHFGCFPAGMEMFPVGKDISEYVKRIIDDSDYYLLIIGGHYSRSVEIEFDYAVSIGTPIIAFDHRDFTKLPADRIDQDSIQRKKLIAFKSKVATGRLVKWWTNEKDLALAVSTSLIRVFDLQPRTGWVRDDKAASVDLQKEIDKLKKEIKSLESSYRSAQQQIKSYAERIKFLESERNGKCFLSVSKTKEKELKPEAEVFTVDGVSFKMIHVEGGTFVMGASIGDADASSDERPAHMVTLSDYWMGETLVTQALWQTVMGENPSRFKGDPNLPVENVSWVDCRVFIRKLQMLTGRRFGLPNEAQWEFAAHGGIRSKGYMFAGSNDIYDVAWIRENAQDRTHPVGQLMPNELGLFDMSGNVWEWCQDWYNSSYYSNSPTLNPIGPASGASRIYRGGCWNRSAWSCRVSYRDYDSPLTARHDLGIRLAL